MWRDLPYLIEVQVCFSILWLFYRLLFSNDSAFGRNRAYLLLSVLLAFTIPLLSIPVLPAGLSSGTGAAEAGNSSVYTPGWFGWIRWTALAGSALMMLLLSVSAARLYLLTRGAATRLLDGGLRISYTDRADTAFSLFNRIYINEKDIACEDIPQVISHELCHVRLRHSWDMILATLVRIVFWWNPFVWFWHRSLREVHEYQADEHVLSRGYDSEQYITLMLQQLTGHSPELVSGFSYSLIRKRLIMISRDKATRFARTKLLLALPAIGLLLLLFSFTERMVAEGGLPAQDVFDNGNRYVPDSRGFEAFASRTAVLAGLHSVAAPQDGGAGEWMETEPAAIPVSESAALPASTVAPAWTETVLDRISPDFEDALLPTVVAVAEPFASLPAIREPEKVATLAEHIATRGAGVKSDMKSYITRSAAFQIEDLENYKVTLDGMTITPESFAVIDSVLIDSICVDNVHRRITAVSGLNLPYQVRININPIPDEEQLASVELKESVRSVLQRYNEELMTRDTLAVIDVAVDQLPRFQGEEIGESRFDKWVTQQLSVPPVAQSKKETKKGYVNVVYTVKADGSVSNVKVVSGSNTALTEAAVATINASPLWSPAMDGGKPVDVTLMARIML